MHSKLMMAVFMMLVAGATPVLSAEKNNPPLVDDLMVLAMVLPKYKVTNASAQEALLEVWKAALGREPTHLHFKTEGLSDREGWPKINLDLRDVPVPEVLRYIQELSGSVQWDIHGRDPEVMQLKLEPLTALYHSEFVLHSVAFSVSREAAVRMGLRDVMTTTEVMAALAKLGVSFPKDSGSAAYWSPQTQMLAVRVWRDEVHYVEALVRMMNQGFKLVKP